MGANVQGIEMVLGNTEVVAATQKEDLEQRISIYQVVYPRVGIPMSKLLFTPYFMFPDRLFSHSVCHAVFEHFEWETGTRSAPRQIANVTGIQG